MSVQATTWVWEHSQAEDTARLVLLAIADSANREGENAWISASTIAKMCRIGHRTAQRKIAELIDSGELEKTGARGTQQANVYRLPGVAGRESVRHSSDAPRYATGDVRQNDAYATGDVGGTPNVATRYATGDVGGTPPMAHTPINPVVLKNYTPLTNNAHKATAKPLRPAPGRVTYSPVFEQFWEIYPRKESKPDAYEAWLAATKFNSPTIIMAGAKRYAENPHRNPAYTKTPARWLHARGWEDGPAEPPRPPQPTRVPGWVERSQVTAQAGQQFLNRYYQQHENRPEQGNDWIAGELA